MSVGQLTTQLRHHCIGLPCLAFARCSNDTGIGTAIPLGDMTEESIGADKINPRNFAILNNFGG